LALPSVTPPARHQHNTTLTLSLICHFCFFSFCFPAGLYRQVLDSGGHVCSCDSPRHCHWLRHQHHATLTLP
jgi:hypothetical protein